MYPSELQCFPKTQVVLTVPGVYWLCIERGWLRVRVWVVSSLRWYEGTQTSNTDWTKSAQTIVRFELRVREINNLLCAVSGQRTDGKPNKPMRWSDCRLLYRVVGFPLRKKIDQDGGLTSKSLNDSKVERQSEMRMAEVRFLMVTLNIFSHSRKDDKASFSIYFFHGFSITVMIRLILSGKQSIKLLKLWTKLAIQHTNYFSKVRRERCWRIPKRAFSWRPQKKLFSNVQTTWMLSGKQTVQP